MDAKDKAKQEIKRLISFYEDLKKSGKYDSFNEDETCRKLILPLFAALGWDTDGRRISDEVTGQETAGGQKRVDYSFNINSSPVLFLEAKQLSADMYRPEFAQQAINYGYSKSVKWVVLSDFEGIEVFNSLVKTKRLSEKTILDLKCTEYLERFDDLWLLSRESVVNGKLNEYAKTKGHISNKVPINELLLEKLLKWRNRLERRISNDNPRLNKEETQECVQKLINRLIFIRTCEDRGIDKENILKNTVKEWESASGKSLLKMLNDIFRDFDDGYNSNLFAEHEIEKLKIDDDILAEVINGLYEDEKEDVSFDFSVIDADMLGSIYEQYLGTIQREGGSKAKRKSHGIYYTPKYIVDYIVENTLGKVLNELLKEKKYKQIGRIKVLDPACGSGSFLIAAYDKILEKIDKPTLFTKFDILKDNIFGVDLDVQAIEIAQLNLLLKVLSQKTKLPTLQHNVNSGNSLVSGTAETLEKYFGEKWRDQKPFDFHEEFGDVFKQGGFDVIIGNPPYIKEDTNRSAFDGLHDNPYYQGKMDIWTLFACRAIDLLKDGGYFSFIAPSSWIGSAGASIFREKILSSGEITKFVDFSDFRVFKDASIQTMIFVFKKKTPRKLYKVQYAKITSKDVENESVARFLASGLNKQIESSIVYEAAIRPSDIGDKSISFSDDTVAKILDKIENAGSFKLSKDDIGNGIDVLQDFISERHLANLKNDTIKKGDGVFVLENSFVEKMKLNSAERDYLKPYYTTAQINRYLSQRKNGYKIIYADKYFREHIGEFPELKAHIDRFKKILTSAFAPYGLHRPREERFFKGKAIFLLRKTMYPAFTYVDFPCYVTRAFLVLKPEKINLKYLTALLNSKLIYFWLKHKGKKQGEQLQIDKEPVMNIPLLKVSEHEQERIAAMVDIIIARNAEFHKTSVNTDKQHSLKAEIKKMEQQIDKEVYKLYGLTADEIKTTEQQNQSGYSR